MDNLNRVKTLLLVALAIVVAAGVIIFAGRPILASYYYRKGVEDLASRDPARLPKAEVNLLRSLRFDPKNPLAHYYLGRVAFGRGIERGRYREWPDANWPKVIRHYEEALRLNIQAKDSVLAEAAHSDLARAYRKLRNYEKAGDILREHIKLYPDDSFVDRFLLATDDFHIFNNPNEALEVLPPALDARDRDEASFFSIYALFGHLYLYFNDFANVKKYAELAIATAPKNERNHHDVEVAHFLLANVYAQEGKFPLAEAEAKTAANLAGVPDASFVCYLARAYLTGKNYSKALATARIAENASSPPRAYFSCLETLGNSYFSLGNTAEAKKYLSAYLDATDALQIKNIFVMRGRAEAQKKLEKLGSVR